MAALCGALGAALASIVASLTYKSGAPGADALEKLGMDAQTLKDELLAAVDSDAAAFDAVLSAQRQPRDSDEQRKARDTAVQGALRHATETPLAVLQGASRVALLAQEAATLGIAASLSDAGVAALCAEAAAEGAYYNVLINLAEIHKAPGPGDADFAKRTRAAAEDALRKAQGVVSSTRRDVRARLENPA